MLILLTFYLLENDRRSVETSFLIRDFCGVKNTIPFPKLIGDHFGVVVKKKKGIISGSESFQGQFGHHFGGCTDHLRSMLGIILRSKIFNVLEVSA